MNFTYDELKKISLTGKHIKPKEAFEIMKDCHNKKTCVMLFKVANSEYQKWYDKNKKFLSTIEDETTYIVSQNNKAFGNYGGYSIFAKSLGQKLRNLPYDCCDRIEHLKLDYAIIVYMEK